MFIANILRPRVIAAVAVATILGSSAYAFAAANTVPASNAGTGAGTISGYVISDIAYTVNSNNTLLDSVAMTVTPNGSGQPTDVSIRLFDASSTWYPCVQDGTTPTLWTCDTAAASLSTFANLTVVAHQ